jgi:hypothetical protein
LFTPKKHRKCVESFHRNKKQSFLFQKNKFISGKKNKINLKMKAQKETQTKDLLVFIQSIILYESNNSISHLWFNAI